MKNWLGTLLILTLVPAAAACGDDETAETGTTTGDAQDVSGILALTGDPVNGQIVYEDQCGQSSCHGDTGDNGTSGSRLSDAVPPLTREQLARVIKFGTIQSGGTMPPVDATDQETADVLEYTIQTFGN